MTWRAADIATSTVMARISASAFAEIRNVAVDVARSVTEKLTGSAADEAKLIPAVDRAMAERTG